MDTRKQNSRHLALAACTLLVTAALALAGGHTWKVNELFSDSTGTIQYVGLRECCGGNGETGVPGHSILSVARNYAITGPSLPPTTGFKTLLFATPAFAALSGVPAPDYIFPAGMVPFIATGGDTIQYFPGNSVTFGAGALPTDGVHALNTPFGGSQNVTCNSPKNFAGATATINLGCTTVMGDVDNNGARNTQDIAAFVRVVTGFPLGGDNPACAEYCTGSLDGNILAFVNDLLL